MDVLFGIHISIWWVLAFFPPFVFCSDSVHPLLLLPPPRAGTDYVNDEQHG